MIIDEQLKAALRGKSLFIATPAYTDTVCTSYVKSLADLLVQLDKLKVRAVVEFVSGCAMLAYARNELCKRFLTSDCTHLLFIDSDNSFEAGDVFTMLAMMSADGNDPYDIVAACPRKKTLKPEFSFAPKTEIGPIDRPIEVHGVGTAFMMVRRRTLEQFCDRYPDRRYHNSFSDFGPITMFFKDELLHGRYVGEDIAFCYFVSKIGLRIWVCPWMRVPHISGVLSFEDTLAEAIQSGLGVASDPLHGDGHDLSVC